MDVPFTQNRQEIVKVARLVPHDRGATTDRRASVYDLEEIVEVVTLVPTGTRATTDRRANCGCGCSTNYGGCCLSVPKCCRASDHGGESRQRSSRSMV